MHLTFDARLRIPFPEPTRIDQQSLYVFNLYRAGSSVVEAAAEALAIGLQRTANNVTRALYDAGTEMFDVHAYGKPSLFLADEGASLLRLCDIGGYLNYGFREVPNGFAADFAHIGASVLIVRDPRDIGISHYAAVAKHDDTNGVYGDHIRNARALAASTELGGYLLSDELLTFLRRIALCYRPLIEKGTVVVHYEDLFVDGRFDIAALCDTLYMQFETYNDTSFTLDAFVANTRDRIANSKVLRGHATEGRIGLHLDLDDDLHGAYSAALQDALDLLGY